MKLEMERNEQILSLLFISGFSAWISFCNSILGVFPAGFLGTGESGEKFYFLPYLKQQLGMDVSQQFWTDAGFLSAQEYLSLLISLIALFFAIRMIKDDWFSSSDEKLDAVDFTGSVKNMPTAISISFLLVLIPIIGLLQGIVTGEEPETFYEKQQLGIEKDGYIHIEIGEYEEFKWNIQYLNGEHEFDIVFLDETNCQRFQEDKPIVYIGELSELSFSGNSITKGPMELDEGNYCLVIDNSDRGDPAPPSWEHNTVFVEYTIWAN